MSDTHLYTIPAYAPFVDTLARFVMDRYGDNPATLTDVIILLPTRRSCRALTDAFIKLTEGKPLLLPRIQPMGDMDEEEALFALQAGGREIELPDVISSTEQRLLLTQLVEAWQHALPEAGGTQRSSLAHSAHLAVELASFLAEIQRQQLSLEHLEHLVPENLASHWQVTLQFLRILIDTWPIVLAEKQKVDPAHYRNLAIAMQCAYWQAEGNEKPVIAAGSTGSLPSVAQLLQTVASLPQGLVVLPGLDMWMEDAAWDVIAPSHPQYGLKQLLQRLTVERSEVKVLAYEQTAQKDRAKLISAMMLPADHTDKWQYINGSTPEMTQGLQFLKTATLQEEAEVIALYLRRVLDVPGKTAALITHERALARKTATILARWGIAIDDSAGIVLNATPPSVLLRLLVKVMESGVSIHSLLSLLKHPMVAGGIDPVACRHFIYYLEKHGLRGVNIQSGFDGILSQAETLKKEGLLEFVHKIAQILRPFTGLRNERTVSLQTLIAAHLKAAYALVETDNKDGKARLLGSDEGKQLAALLDDMLVSSHAFKAISPSDYMGLFDAVLAGKVYRPRYGKHPRLSILSPIEARMLPFDFVILGGLNEGVWPALPDIDPWMSRGMRTQFGLPQLERQIGLAAHDFAQMVCHKDVLVTRSEKVKGMQTLPSRWVLKLDILLSRLGLLRACTAYDPWKAWLECLHHTDQLGAIAPPAPTPPISARPQRISVTDVERWMRNPYGLYAKKILGLRMLKPLDDMPSLAEFGNIVHAVLDDYVKLCDTPEMQNKSHEEHMAILLALADEALKDYALHPVTYTFWFSRFNAIAEWFIQQERHKRAQGVLIASEQWGEIEIEAGFMLGAKADRIESYQGVSTLIDYKTGTIPTNADIALGFSPQMVLEGLIAMQGGFASSGITDPGHLALQYWKMSGGEKPVEEKPIGQSAPRKNQTVEELIQDACEGMKALVSVFSNPSTPYLATPNPDKAPGYNDYDHLARTKEWEG